MESLYSELIENLEEQLATQQLLLDYAHEKKDYLVEGKISELEYLLKREEEVIMKSGKLENTRQNIQKELGEKIDIKPGNQSGQGEPALSDFIEACEESEEKEKLQKLFDDLAEILSELKKINTQNNELIKSSLDYVNYALDLFTSSNKDPGTYSKDLKEGKKDDDKGGYRNNILDKRI